MGGGGSYRTPNRRLGPAYPPFGLIKMTMMMMSVFATHNWIIGLPLLFGFMVMMMTMSVSVARNWIMDLLLPFGFMVMMIMMMMSVCVAHN